LVCGIQRAPIIQASPNETPEDVNSDFYEYGFRQTFIQKHTDNLISLVVFLALVLYYVRKNFRKLQKKRWGEECISAC
jgi:hypothetical protein